MRLAATARQRQLRRQELRRQRLQALSTCWRGESGLHEWSQLRPCYRLPMLTSCGSRNINSLVAAGGSGARGLW